jgi:prepilin-type N-terminal cleavage/methylation domain-containing protein
LAGTQKFRPLGGSKGYTLAELVVVLALLGLVLSIIYPLFFFVQASFNRASAESDAVQEARLLLLQMGSEVREARKPAPALDAVMVPSPERLDIYSDLNGDGRPEMISYRLRAGMIERRVASPLEAAYPFSYPDPVTWTTVVGAVANSVVFSRHTVHAPRFTVTVNLDVHSADGTLSRPVSIRADLTVREGSEAS